MTRVINDLTAQKGKLQAENGKLLDSSVQFLLIVVLYLTFSQHKSASTYISQHLRTAFSRVF